MKLIQDLVGLYEIDYISQFGSYYSYMEFSSYKSGREFKLTLRISDHSGHGIPMNQIDNENESDMPEFLLSIVIVKANYSPTEFLHNNLNSFEFFFDYKEDVEIVKWFIDGFIDKICEAVLEKGLNYVPYYN